MVKWKCVNRTVPLIFKTLVDEPCNASCIDVDNTRRLKDEEVRELIAQQSGAVTEDAFQELEREQQENIIVWLRDEGASVRQIVSHTGFTTKQVRNLTDKDKKKQADWGIMEGQKVPVPLCLVRMPNDKPVVIQGLKDCIVAEHDNTLLICQLSEEQRIKEWHE